MTLPGKETVAPCMGATTSQLFVAYRGKDTHHASSHGALGGRPATLECDCRAGGASDVGAGEGHVESRLNIGITSRHPASAWMLAHLAEIVSSCQAGSGDRTAYERASGKPPRASSLRKRYTTRSASWTQASRSVELHKLLS